MTLALFGGTFDPPHLGHVALLQHAISRFDPERVLVVPAGDDPPHKRATTPGETRRRLAELAFGRLPRVEISDVELLAGGPRYAVDTLRWASGRADDLLLLLGADQLAAFAEWREPEEILSLARVAVASRPGVGDDAVDTVASLLGAKRIVRFSIPAYTASSTEIRARVGEGASVGRFLPIAVEREIAKRGLYR